MVKFFYLFVVAYTALMLSIGVGAYYVVDLLKPEPQPIKIERVVESTLDSNQLRDTIDIRQAYNVDIY